MRRFIFEGSYGAFERRVLWVALATHLIAAVFSVGFHNYDEMYQILEFANYKLGGTPVEDLPWEFEAQIRPWLMPAFVVGAAKLFRAIGIESPFALATFLRILSALIGWLSCVVLVRCCRFWFKEEIWRRWAVFGACLSWFLPYLHARPSSESWGASFLVLGFFSLIYWIELEKSKGINVPLWKFVVGGLCLGVSFEARFQVGIALASGFLWVLLFYRVAFWRLAAVTLGFFLVFGLGRYADSWGSGEWVFAPWNYFRVNLIESKAASFGVHPWYDYVRMGLERGVPPLSIVFVLGTFLGWLLKPKLSITWVTLPFVLVHSAIGHKEFRFLIPVLPLIPILCVFGFQNWKRRKAVIPSVKRAILRLGENRGVQAGLLWFNAACLLAMSLFPARYEIPVLKYIADQEISILYYDRGAPYIWANLQSHFYRPVGGIELFPLEKALSEGVSQYWLFANQMERPLLAAEAGARCELKTRLAPWPLTLPKLSWIIRQARLPNWGLYFCRRGDS